MSNESIERLTKPYKEHLRESLKTDDDYVGYLSACHAEGAETFALAVRDVLSFVRADHERIVKDLEADRDYWKNFQEINQERLDDYNQCAATRPWPLNCRHDHAEIYTQDYIRVSADRVAPTVDQKELRESIEYVLWNWSHSTSDTVRELLNLFAKYLLTAFPAAATVDHLLQDAGVILIENEDDTGARVVIRFSKLQDAERLHSALLRARAADTAISHVGQLGTQDETVSGFNSPERLSHQGDNSMTKNYDDFRAGMLRAAEMARDELKRAPEAAQGHDCVYMGGYEDACDHLSLVIAQAAVIDSVRIAGPQPDWQYHISLLLPEGIEDETLLRIYQVVEHELRAASVQATPDQAAKEAAEEIIAYLQPYDLRWGIAELSEKVAAIIAKHVVGPREDAENG